MPRIQYAKGLEIYGQSPLWIQNVFALLTRPIPRHVMLGSGFHAFFQELDRTQWHKTEKLKKLQESKLRALIRHAYENVPYYRNVFRQRNIRPGEIKTTEDLTKLPILTKDDVRNHFGELIAVNAKDFKHGKGMTSGTTGRPLAFHLDQQNREIEYATLWRQRKWANVDLDSRIASIRGFRGGLRWINLQSGKPRWKFNALSKDLEFNIFGLDKTMLKAQIQRLAKFQPCLIEGYPSAIELFADFVLKNNIDSIQPSAVQTSSEQLTEHQRTVIEKAFGCRVWDWYGQSEYVVTAGECHDGSYHIMESGIMEFIRDGEHVSQGEIGELIGTGLYNYSMPFIRYRTTDLGRYSEEKCSCGRGLPIVQSIEGKTYDVILTPDGRLFTGLAIAYYWDKEIAPFTPNVGQVHIIQKSKGKLLIETVGKGGYTESEAHTIVTKLRLLLGSEIQIELRELESLQTGRKRRFTESELNISLI